MKKISGKAKKAVGTIGVRPRGVTGLNETAKNRSPV